MPQLSLKWKRRRQEPLPPDHKGERPAAEPELKKMIDAALQCLWQTPAETSTHTEYPFTAVVSSHHDCQCVKRQQQSKNPSRKGPPRADPVLSKFHCGHCVHEVHRNIGRKIGSIVQVSVLIFRGEKDPLSFLGTDHDKQDATSSAQSCVEAALFGVEGGSMVSAHFSPKMTTRSVPMKRRQSQR